MPVKKTREVRFTKFNVEAGDWDSLLSEFRKLERKFEEVDRRLAALEGTTATTGLSFTSRSDEAGGYTYTGEALIGSAEGAAVWKISRSSIDSNGNVDVDFADGNQEYDNVWSRRTALNYK